MGSIFLMMICGYGCCMDIDLVLGFNFEVFKESVWNEDGFLWLFYLI